MVRSVIHTARPAHHIRLELSNIGIAIFEPELANPNLLKLLKVTVILGEFLMAFRVLVNPAAIDDTVFPFARKDIAVLETHDAAAPKAIIHKISLVLDKNFIGPAKFQDPIAVLAFSQASPIVEVSIFVSDH